MKGCDNKARFKWRLVLFGLAHIIIFALLFQTVYKVQFTGTGLYFDYASKVLSGNLPYRDFAVEYPPFALLFFILPRLLAPSWHIFSIYYQAEVIIFDLIGIVVIYDIACRLKRSAWKMLTVYTLIILAMGPIIGQQYDIFPAVMSLAAVYFFWLGKHKIAWALLALGTLTKIYPLVIAPVFLIYYIRNRQYRHIWSGIITFGITSLVILLPFLIIDPSSLWVLYSYHSQRGIQLESIYSSVLLIGVKLGWLVAEPRFDFGSWNLVGAVPDIIARAYLLIMMLSLATTYWFIYRRMKAALNPANEVMNFPLLTVGVLIATSEVLSPQYLIWLCLLIPLFSGRFQYILAAVFIAISTLTYYIFPLHYLELIELKFLMLAILLARNILIITMVLIMVIFLSRNKKAGRFADITPVNLDSYGSLLAR